MADEPTQPATPSAPPAPVATAEAPASSAPDSTHSVTEWAKAEAAKLEATPTVEVPAPAAPESAAAASTEDSSDDAGSATPPSTRRERDEARRAEIRKEVEAEYQQRQAVAQQTQQQQQAQRDWDVLLERASAGDQAAQQQLAHVLSSGRTTQAAEQQGQNKLLAKMGADIINAVTSIEGADDAARAAMLKAPTVQDFGKVAFNEGIRSQAARIAALEAENTSLKGKVAAQGPSPLPTNGTNGRANALPAGSGMRAIAAQVAAEMGLSL